jgi:glycolate oxidase iron-sulfur subunit
MPANGLAEKLKITLDEDQLMNCMRCGFCLPACPTYRETGVEAESPRGRIALMKAAVDGVMQPTAGFIEQMDHCLGCRACETACPADVKYGRLIERARDAIEDAPGTRSGWARFLRRAAFRGVFPHPRRMRLLGGALKLYQRSGLARLARGSGALKLLPAHLAEMERILPDAAGDGVVARIDERLPAAGGEPIAKVGLFRGCIMDILFTDTNAHTAELLAEAGFEVIIPDAQVCCGALHAHGGDLETARELAVRNIRAFREAGVDYIVSNAGGCGALLVEYDHLLKDDSERAGDAAWFASRVIDVAELLLRRGSPLAFASPEPVRVTYQDSCHLRNVMKSSDAPRTLIAGVEGAEYCEMKDSDRCCGSAGIYNITQPEMSGSILAHKMEHANATGADVILTSNPGCLLQMKLGIERHGDPSRTKAMHVVDFLHERMRHKM